MRNARVKAQQYDLAQQQALYDRVMSHGEKALKRNAVPTAYSLKVYSL